MTTHNFTVNELINVGEKEDVLFRKALDAGYTNVTIEDVGGKTTHINITFDEADDKPTTLTKLEAAVDPVLSVDNTAVEIVGDTVDTGSTVLSDSRGAAASGKTVLLTIMDPGGLILSGGGSYVLDASGQATVNFGASTIANWCTGLIKLSFSYASDETQKVEMTVRYTGI